MIAARPETIFRYFTYPARFRPLTGQGSVLDPEPGGHLRVGYPTEQVAGGRVVAVEPDRRIVFTWGCEGDGQAVPAGSSTVEITLAPVADGTEVRCAIPACPPGSRPWRMWPAGGTPWPPWPSPGAADQLAPVLGERVADWLAA